MSVYLAHRVAALGISALLAAPAVEAQPEPALAPRSFQLGYTLDHADAPALFKTAGDAAPRDPAAFRLAAATAWTAQLFDDGAITVADYLGQARAAIPRPAPASTTAA